MTDPDLKSPPPELDGSPGPAEQLDPTGHPWRWWILAVVLMAEVLDLLDSTIVNVAGPSIRTDLGGAISTIQWIAAGYTLAFGVLLVIGGRLGDRWGRRRMFIIGAAGFTAMSVLCAVAQSPEMLIGVRVLQGAFGAVLLPQGLGTMRSVFPPEQLGKAFSSFGPVIGLSAVCGPILAGALVDLDAWGTGWRLIFLINLPLGIAAVVGAVRWMPKDPPRPGVVIDAVSGLLLAIALFLVIYPLIQGPEHSWPLWTYLSLAGGALFGIAFLVHERRAVSPLIEPGLLTNRSFTGGLLLLLVFFAGVTGLMLTVSLFVQGYLHYTPLRAGLALSPLALGLVVGAIGFSSLITRFGRYLIVLGLVVSSAGTVALALVVHHFGGHTTNLDLFGPAFVIGIGMGAVVAPLFDIIIAGVSQEQSGSASGTLTAAQQLAGSIGVAGVTTVYLSLVKEHSIPDAMAISAVVVAGLMALGVTLVFLLPAHARAEE